MGCLRKSCAAALLSLLALSFPSRSSADSGTFNSLFFQPAIGRSPYLMLHSSETLHRLQFDVKGVASFGYHPLDLRQGGARVQGVIDRTLVSDFAAAVGVMDWAQIGLDFPLILINRFRAPLVVPAPAAVNHFDVGDLRVEAKLKLLDGARKPVGLALIPFLTAPTGSDTHFVGDPGVTGGLKVAVDGWVHKKIALAMNLGYQGGRKVSISNVNFQHRLLLGAGVMGTPYQKLDVFGEINAVAAFNKLLHDRDVNPVEAMVGARYDIKDTGVAVSAGGGTCIICGAKGARARAVLGLEYRLNTAEFRERDAEAEAARMARLEKGMSAEKLAGLKQSCPGDPSEYDAGLHDAACPKYYELREITGLILRCPAKEEDYDPRVHDAACPKVFNLAEIFSAEEIMNIYTLAAEEMGMLCPQDPGDYNPQINDLGCPKYYDLRDLVTLAARCPDDPDQYREGVDDPSCPKFFTLREAYSAPELAAIFDLPLEAFAQPSDGGVRMIGGEIKTARPIFFDFNSARIKPADKPLIDEVVALVNRTAWIKRVRVGGNADAIGTSEANELISMRRAEAVIAHMRAHGIRPGVELVPVAYGANRPVASNTTAAGRRQNRRAVVFIVTGYMDQRGRRPPPAAVHEPPPPSDEASEAEGTRSDGSEARGFQVGPGEAESHPRRLPRHRR